VRSSLKNNVIEFKNYDKRYSHILNLTMIDMNSILDEITLAQNEAALLIGHLQNSPRSKRSLLPLGGLFHFLFGTGDQKDINQLKDNVQDLYANQLNHKKVLGDVISVTNISRALINENILKINELVQTVSEIKDTVGSIVENLVPLFTARKFLWLQAEYSIHHSRIRSLISQTQADLILLRKYLNIHSSNKLTTDIIDPTHLAAELVKIQSLLPDTLSLPENPVDNIWHFYKFLTIAPVTHLNSMILMIQIPLIDLDSRMTLYRVYNLPIFNPIIEKSLNYKLEGNTLAITKDNKHAALLSASEFMQCTMADGHFCALNTGLYNIDTAEWCITALFRRDNNKISKFCTLQVTNITGPTAVYLDQGHWAISLAKKTEMEVKCTPLTTVKTLNPPLTFITLQPTCSAFSPELKLPPYFKQYSRGLTTALKSANLHIKTFNPNDFRIWSPFNVSNITKEEIKSLKELKPAPAVPIGELKAQMDKFRYIDFSKNRKPWMYYYIGGGSGFGILLFVIVALIVYWRCKSLRKKVPKIITPANPASEAPASCSTEPRTRVGNVRFGASPNQIGDLSVGVKDSDSSDDDKRKEAQLAFSTALLDHLNGLGVDVSMHRRRLPEKQGPELIEMKEFNV
jgi:hypothetical protein